MSAFSPMLTKPEAGLGPAPISSALRAALTGTAVLSLCVVILGGFETSARLWAGIDPADLPFAQSALMTRGPRSVAELLVVVLLVPGMFTWWEQRGRTRKGIVLRLTTIALIAGALAGVIGFFGIPQNQMVALHAVFGHIVFACITAATVFALAGSPDEKDSRIPKIGLGGGFPLRGLALWLPFLIVTQIATGASYPHEPWGVLPHLAIAMLVAFLIVAESTLLLQRAPEHQLLRRAAHWTMASVLVQVALGIGTYLLRLLDFQDTNAWFVLSLIHVTVGSITFASSIYLAVSVRTCVVEL